MAIAQWSAALGRRVRARLEERKLHPKHRLWPPAAEEVADQARAFAREVAPLVEQADRRSHERFSRTREKQGFSPASSRLGQVERLAGGRSRGRATPQCLPLSRHLPKCRLAWPP